MMNRPLLLSVLGVYAWLYLTAGVTSINNHLTVQISANRSYFPLIIFAALSFFSFYGVYVVGWMMLSEIFPAK